MTDEPSQADRDGTGNPGSDTGGTSVDLTWSRLDSRMLAVAVARIVISVLPIAAALTVFGANLDRGVRTALFAAVAVGVTGAVSEAFRWFTVRYRVTEERVERRSGLFTREARWVPRERVRTVDLKAGVLQRLFGLCVLRIGTGRQAGQGAGMRLEAIRAEDGERLRDQLLSGRSVTTPSTGATTGDIDAPGAADETSLESTSGERLLAAFRISRVPYSLLSWWTFGLPAIVLAGLYQLLSTAGVRPDERELIEVVTEHLGPLPFQAAVTVIVVGLVALGAIGAAAFSFETWWRYRLERRVGDGVIALRHGLLTLRSKDLEERRMRGVELVETIPLRPAQGAELRAIMTGLSKTESPWGARAEALGPSMSLTEATEIAEELLENTDEHPTEPGLLRAHPSAALRRRRFRGLLAAAMATAALAGLGQLAGILASGPFTFAVSTVILAPPAVLIGLWAARDAHHNLGNRLTSRYLVTRCGLLSRRTAALQRDGIVGWTFRATLFQRRLGLLTPTATTAAGRSAYPAPDMRADAAVELADRATPGLLDPFIAE